MRFPPPFYIRGAATANFLTRHFLRSWENFRPRTIRIPRDSLVFSPVLEAHGYAHICRHRCGRQAGEKVDHSYRLLIELEGSVSFASASFTSSFHPHRRLKRDIAERGRDLEGVLQQYRKFVKPVQKRKPGPPFWGIQYTSLGFRPIYCAYDEIS